MFNNFVFFTITAFAIGYGQEIFDLQKSPIETQFCLLPSNKGYGLCINFFRCDPALRAYHYFTPLFYCNGLVQSVCCEVNGKNASLELIQERISEQKCQEVFPLIDPLAAVGGILAEDYEFQHMAAIAWRTQNGGYDYLCGGSLISKTFVLTAAHCASFKGVAPTSVRIGGVKLNETRGEGHISIKKIIIHPKYTRKQVYNDIALLELEKPSTYSPACLWQTTKISDNGAVAIGYGHTTFAGKGSDVLIKVNLSIYDLEECGQTYQPEYKLENGLIESQVCAADRGNKQDTCQGDSGGPLMVQQYKSYPPAPYIVGITSFGQGCAAGPPSVYTRVSSFLDWIESIVWPGGEATGYFIVREH